MTELFTLLPIIIGLLIVFIKWNLQTRIDHHVWLHQNGQEGQGRYRGIHGQEEDKYPIQETQLPPGEEFLD